jgi:hypothetical protein
MPLRRETQLTVAMVALVIVSAVGVGAVLLRNDVFGRYFSGHRKITRSVDPSSACVVPPLAGVAGANQGSGKTTQQSRFVVLPDQGRQSPDGTWTPSPANIAGVEGSICQIATLSDKRHAADFVDVQIAHPEQYYRQYFGVFRGGRRYIYINAFCGSGRVEFFLWRQSIVGVSGGGNCFWQALYDPLKGEISDLKINGPM